MEKPACKCKLIESCRPGIKGCEGQSLGEGAILLEEPVAGGEQRVLAAGPQGGRRMAGRQRGEPWVSVSLELVTIHG